MGSSCLTEIDKTDKAAFSFFSSFNIKDTIIQWKKQPAVKQLKYKESVNVLWIKTVMSSKTYLFCTAVSLIT